MVLNVVINGCPSLHIDLNYGPLLKALLLSWIEIEWKVEKESKSNGRSRKRIRTTTRDARVCALQRNRFLPRMTKAAVHHHTNVKSQLKRWEKLDCFKKQVYYEFLIRTTYLFKLINDLVFVWLFSAAWNEWNHLWGTFRYYLHANITLKILKEQIVGLK